MSDYLVTWKIDINAESPRQAAEIAKEIQQENFLRGNLASYFQVMNHKTGDEETINLRD